MRGLKDKVVLVTGAAQGIGAAISKRFSEEGSKVVILDLNLDAAEATAKTLKNATAVQADITDYEQVSQGVKKLNEELGGIDILINNAGWDIFMPFLKTEPSHWQKLVSINLMGALNLCHTVLPQMVERGAGAVVNIASDAGRVGSSGEAVYAACKGGIVSFTKTLAREHSRHGLRFNVVCPGPTKTKLFERLLDTANNPEKLEEAFRKAVPMRRLGEPEDLAGAVCFLASDDAAYITGQVLSVSGGLTMHG